MKSFKSISMNIKVPRVFFLIGFCVCVYMFLLFFFIFNEDEIRHIVFLSRAEDPRLNFLWP